MRHHATRGPGLAGVVVALGLAAGAGAAEFTVDSTADDGAGSLREAIEQANASAGPDTIVFTLDPDATIELDTALPVIDGALTIDAGAVTGLSIQGPAGDLVTIDAETTVSDIDLFDGAVTLEMDRTLTALIDRATEFGSDLTGAGALAKQGTADLTLSGTNDYSGGTTVEAGRLIGDTDALQGDIEIESAGILRFTQALDATFAGAITGAGSVEKRDLGALTLTSTANDWSGGTTITGGEIVATTDTFPGDVVVETNGTFVLDQDVDDAFAGAVSGDGAFAKRGTGTVTLTGAHSHAGGTLIEEGALVGPASAFPSDVELGAGTTLFLDQASGSGTLSGVISGDGALVKQGSGTVRLTGANSWTGGTLVDAGTLSVTAQSLSGDATIASGARVLFDQANAGSYAGVLSGDGALEKQGSGTLTLGGAHAFTGGTTIGGGTLDLTGSLASDVTVSSGGRLGGTGSVNAPVTVRGAVAPGSGGIGTLSVDAVTFESGGDLEIEVEPGGMADRLVVAGTADVGSGRLLVDPTPGDYSGGPTFTVLQSGGLVGSFPDPQDLLLLDIALVQVGDDLQLTVTETAANLDEIGTPNQNAVGGALATHELDAAFETIFDNLAIVPADEGGDVLDSMGGEPISAFTSARVAQGELFQRAVHRRLRGALFTHAPSPLLGLPPRGDDPPPWRPGARGLTDVAAGPEGEVGLWLDVDGLIGGIEGDGNSADADYLVGGGAVGADARIGDGGLAGLAVGYARTRAEIDEPDGRVDADTAQAAVYAGYATTRVHLGVSGRYAWSRADSWRDVAVGDLAYTADGDFDSQDFGARAELALEAFPNGAVSLQPLGAFSWGHYERESFDESGAGVLSLDVDEEEIDTATLQLGARLAGRFAMQDGLYFAPEVRAYWIHEFGDLERRVEASLGGAPFEVRGAEGERDGLLAGVGWAVGAGENVRASLEYDARLDAERLDHLAGVSIRVAF